MEKVYLDNASTTRIYPEVIQKLITVLQHTYGNPSSTHSLGQQAKTHIELARKSIANHINATAQEIIFTSSATEANNLILKAAVENLNINHIITSKIEHHAVLETIEYLQDQKKITVSYVEINSKGCINYNHLETLLINTSNTLISLMYVNNEIGTLLDIEKVSLLAKKYNALFHTDAVQAIGKQKINLNKISVDFLTASAHKFHGPKGIGFAYVRKNLTIKPQIHGGQQEKGLRAGTECVHNIVAMAKALSLTMQNFEEDQKHLNTLNDYLVEQINLHFPQAHIIANKFKQNNITNVVLPLSPTKTSLIVFYMDMNGIAISRGSACQSGSSKPSHVLENILDQKLLELPNIRISFSKFNTINDIDLLINAIKKIN